MVEEGNVHKIDASPAKDEVFEKTCAIVENILGIETQEVKNENENENEVEPAPEQQEEEKAPEPQEQPVEE